VYANLKYFVFLQHLLKYGNLLPLIVTPLNTSLLFLYKTVFVHHVSPMKSLYKYQPCKDVNWHLILGLGFSKASKGIKIPKGSFT